MPWSRLIPKVCKVISGSMTHFFLWHKFGFAEYIPQVYKGRFGRKHRFHRVTVSPNILITGNAPVRSRYETEWCQAKWLQKAPCPVGADPAHNLESWTEPPYFFNFSVTWHSALVQCLQEKKWYTILRSAWGRGVDVSVFLLFLCRDCCYDNKKLKISYPVEPVFSAKPAPVNLWNILGQFGFIGNFICSNPTKSKIHANPQASKCMKHWCQLFTNIATKY